MTFLAALENVKKKGVVKERSGNLGWQVPTLNFGVILFSLLSLDSIKGK